MLLDIRVLTANVVVDSNNRGDVFGFENSVKITGGSSANMLISEIISVDSEMDYVLKMYQNVQNLNSGGWAVWIDEFDENNGWISGQWLGGNYANFVGSRYYEYRPSSSDVLSVDIIIYSEANSELTLYLDSVFFNALGPSDPFVDRVPPVISLNGNSVVNLEVGDDYVDEGASAFDNVDGDVSDLIVIGGDEVDTSVAGAYVVLYSVSDAAGNLAEMERTVNVFSVATGDSLVPNHDFEDTTSGWADYWTQNNVNVVVDSNNNGYGDFPRNSLKIIGGD